MQRIFSKPWNDYQLLDAGNNKKLERWGSIITIRPDINAYFGSGQMERDWYDIAHFEYIEKPKSTGFWKILKENTEQKWQINFKQLTLNLQLTQYKHLGIFPEQRANWDVIAERLPANARLLNLFAYTGIASMVARQQGADVFHCDSVKQVINWGKTNMESSGLSDVHWILEDALTFATREMKRGKKYDAIIMDPPAYGIGAKKQRWKIEGMFPELLKVALELREKSGFIICNTYSPRLPAEKLLQITENLTTTEKVEVSTLSIKSKTGKILDYGQRTFIH